MSQDLTLIEAAAALNVSVKTVRKLALNGTLPTYRIGRLWRVQPSALATCRARLAHTPPEPIVPARPLRGPERVLRSAASRRFY